MNNLIIKIITGALALALNQSAYANYTIKLDLTHNNSAFLTVAPPPTPVIPVDPDSDLDGYVDSIDVFPNDPTEWLDDDSDSYGNNIDVFPDDPTEWLDDDSDSYGNNIDVFPNDPTEWADDDLDSYGNNSDFFPNDPNRHLNESYITEHFNGTYINGDPYAWSELDSSAGFQAPFTGSDSGNIVITNGYLQIEGHSTKRNSLTKQFSTVGYSTASVTVHFNNTGTGNLIVNLSYGSQGNWTKTTPITISGNNTGSEYIDISSYIGNQIVIGFEVPAGSFLDSPARITEVNLGYTN